MQLDGRRTKKLRVAFHFQTAQQAAWKCDTCRKSGLEIKRRCGWMPAEQRGTSQVVWARGRVATEECPVSYISAESQVLLEQFQLWKLFGNFELAQLPARLVEAIVILENELRTEDANAQH